MATVRLMPDPIAFTVAYVKSRTDVAALQGTGTLNGRIGTKVPQVPTWPLALIRLLPGFELIPGHLDDSIIQVDVYGFKAGEAGAPPSVVEHAYLMARLLRAVLLEMPKYPSAKGVCTNVDTIRTPQTLPDNTDDPDRPRFSADYKLTLHPLPL